MADFRVAPKQVGRFLKLADLVKTVAAGHDMGFDLTPLITHTLPLREIEKGMDLLKSGQAAKVILYP